MRCPHCPQGRLEPARATAGAVTCPRCGHRAGQVQVAEQLWLEQQDALLHARLDWVRHQVATGETSGATGVPTGPFTGPPGSPGSPGNAGHPPFRAQSVLLGIGALCLVLAAVVFVAVAWSRLGALGQVGALLLVVAALSGSAHALRTRYRSTAETLAGVAAAVAAVALVAAPRLGLGADWMRDRPATWAAIALVLVAVLSGVLAGVSRLVAWQVGLVAAVVAAGFSAAIAVSGGQQVGPVGCAGLAVAAAAVILLHPGRGSTFHADAPWVGAGLGGMAVLLGFSGYGHPEQAGQWALAWLVLAVCAAATVLPMPGSPRAATVPEPVRPAVAAIVGLAAGQVPPLLAVEPALHLSVPTPVLALVGAGFLAGVALPRFRLPAAVAAGACWVVALPLLPSWDAGVQPQVPLYLAVVAVALLALSFVPGMLPAVWPAAVLGGIALWTELADREVGTLEVYTAPVAGLLLLAGLLVLRVHRDAGSVAVLGPALALLALPSAMLAFSQAPAGDDPGRAVAVILGGAAAAALGSGLRLLAPLMVGLAAVVIAGLGQLLALADTLPRWVSLAVAGALLLAAGFSAERLARTGRHLWSQARRMR